MGWRRGRVVRNDDGSTDPIVGAMPRRDSGLYVVRLWEVVVDVSVVIVGGGQA